MQLSLKLMAARLKNMFQLLQQARATYQSAIQGGASPNEAWNQAFGTTFRR